MTLLNRAGPDRLRKIAILSLVFLTGALCAYIIFDIRLNTTGGAYRDLLNAVSIAISRQIYGAQGSIGYEDVLIVLREIPVVDYKNIDSYEKYQILINHTLHKATLLKSLDQTKLHGGTDYFYIQFISLAFTIFGIKIQSLTYLWLSLFVSSATCYLVAFWNHVTRLFILSGFAMALWIAVICNAGGDTADLLGINNQRFLNVLALIPLLHILLRIMEPVKERNQIVLMLFQGVILLFVFLCRSAAQWMLVTIFLTSCFSIWLARKNSSSSVFYLLTTRLWLFILMVVTIIQIKQAIPTFLHNEYKKELWQTSHVFWGAMVVGLTTDPVLREKYVCSDLELKDRLQGFTQRSCRKSSGFLDRLSQAAFDEPGDWHMYQAAVRYLRENGSSEQLGSEDANPRNTNLRWQRFDQIQKIIYFQMIVENPLDVIFMYVIAKPLKYFSEVFRYGAYFVRSISEFVYPKLLTLFLIVILFSYLILVRRLRFITDKKKSIFLLPLFLILFLTSGIPSIVFFSQSHTIVDSVTILCAFCFCIPFLNRTLLEKKET